jgi:hypothetical protein
MLRLQGAFIVEVDGTNQKRSQIWAHCPLLDHTTNHYYLQNLPTTGYTTIDGSVIKPPPPIYITTPSKGNGGIIEVIANESTCSLLFYPNHFTA